MGFFDKLFGNDASFLGFMDFTGELDDEPQEEIEVTLPLNLKRKISRRDHYRKVKMANHRASASIKTAWD